jgi:hypothetical protein
MLGFSTSTKFHIQPPTCHVKKEKILAQQFLIYRVLSFSFFKKSITPKQHDKFATNFSSLELKKEIATISHSKTTQQIYNKFLSS